MATVLPTFIAVKARSRLGPRDNIKRALVHHWQTRGQFANKVYLHPLAGATRPVAGVTIAYHGCVPKGVVLVGRDHREE